MATRAGYLGALLSALLFGLYATLNKAVLAEVNATVVAGSAYFFAGLSLALVRFSPLRKRIQPLLETSPLTEAKINRRDLVTLTIVILCGAIIAPYLFVNGLNQTTAINASLLQQTESLFTVVIAFVFLKEKAGRKDWAGIFLLVIGAIFLSTNGEFYRLTLTESIIGNTLIVTGCLFWGVDNNLSRFLSKKEDLILITILKCAIGGVIVLLLSWVFGLSLDIPLTAYPYLVSVGALSTGFSIIFFLIALREIGSLKTGIIFSLSSLFGAVFASVMLHESFTIVHVIAGLTMMLGVYIMYRM